MGRRVPPVLAWVAMTVVGLHAAIFILSLTALTVVASISDSKFATVALKDYWGFLLWTNLDLLRGYAVVAVGYIVFIYPTVRFLLRNKVRPGRWAIIWRTLVISVLLMGFFWLRLIQSRPYFLTAENYDHWYFDLLSGLPEQIRTRVYFLLFDFLPGLAWVGMAIFYGTRLLARLLPGVRRAFRWRVAAC
jgi:hypothetical protein